MNNKCIVCKSTENKVVFKEFDTDILKCSRCGHVFSSFEINQDYDGYFGDRVTLDENSWWITSHEKMYCEFCSRFLKNRSGRLLDAGCGLGYFVRISSTFPGWETFGYEISSAAVDCISCA